MDAVHAHFRNLEGVQQRVAQEERFKLYVNRLETEVTKQVTRLQEEQRQLKEQCRLLVQLNFNPDVKLRSRDGVEVAAVKQVLIDASSVLKRMFAAEHTAEAQSGAVETNERAAVLTHVVKTLHCPDFVDKEAVEVLLGACELASRWELDSVLRSTASALGCNLDAGSAAKVLAAADKHVEADPNSAAWQKLLNEAAAVFARTPAVFGPKLEMLSLNAILEVVNHVKGAKFTVPALTIDFASLAVGELSTSSKKVRVWRPRNNVRFDEYQLKGQTIQDGTRLGLSIVRTGPEECQPQVELAIQVNDAVTKWDRANLKTAWPAEGCQDWLKVISVATGGKITVQGSVTITGRQRQADVLNMWLLATKSIREPLGPAGLLLCLRAHACARASGIDIDKADPDVLKKKLSERSLETSGSIGALRTRLRDVLHAALPTTGHLASISRAFAELTAAFYGKCVANGSLFDLDAASFSMVLAQDIEVESESAVLEHAVCWASREGRTEEMVSRVMPLVRFPLVSHQSPSDALRRLQQGNAVVSQLIKEAISLQVKSVSAVASFVPTKHRLIEGVLPDHTDYVPRAKRRKYCKDDKVESVDPAEAIFASKF